MANKRALIYHNLSIMLDSGVPMLRTLKTAVAGLKGPLANVFSAVTKTIAAGNGLAETMAKYPKVFPPLDLLLIETGETSGNLAESLDMLSKWYDFRSRTNRIILAGLPLPILLLHATAAIAPLPVLFLGSNGFSDYIHQAMSILALFYVPAAVILGILFLTPRTGPARWLLDSFILKVPILGKAVHALAMSRYCRAFYMLYKAGVPIVHCARNSAGIAGNLVVKNLLEGGAKSAQSGGLVSQGFSKNLPDDFLNIWQVGEETGDLDKITLRLAQNYADTAELLLTELAGWLPRLVYFFVCIIMVINIFKGFSQIMSSYPL